MFGNPNHSGRFVKFANRLSKVKPLYYALGCFVFTLLVILFHHLEGFEYIFYYLYYCPIYLFLGKLFYGAFYVELFTKFLWILLLSLACYLFARSFFKSRKFSSAAISIVFLIVVIILAKYAISDIPSVVEGKYETTQATLQQVENRHQGRQGINYYISTNKRLRLNIYQYHELEKIKRQFENEDVNLEDVTLTVNYLPNTKCVLNYQIE